MKITTLISKIIKTLKVKAKFMNKLYFIQHLKYFKFQKKMDSMKNALFFIAGKENEIKNPNGKSNNTFQFGSENYRKEFWTIIMNYVMNHSTTISCLMQLLI